MYRHNSTHEGWPVLKNERGIYCHRYRLASRWLLSASKPGSNQRSASIAAPEGPLPLGAHTWQCSADRREWEDHTLTVTLLATEADAVAAEQQLQAAFEAEQVAKAAAARAQLDGVRSVIVSGCPRAECNGTFERLMDVGGWPRFRNDQGQLLFYHTRGQNWAIHSVFTEEFLVVATAIRALDGLLPTETAPSQTGWVFRVGSGASSEVAADMRATLGEA